MIYNRIPVNILISLEKLILKFIRNLKQPQIAKTILKQNIARILTHFKNLLFCDPRDRSPTGSSVHGIFQKRILEWVAIPFTRGSSRPRDWTQVSCIGGRFFTVWATSSAQFSCSVASDSLQPHEMQHARPPSPSPTPRVHPNSCPSQWCHPAISSSVIPFSSCPQSLPAS